MSCWLLLIAKEMSFRVSYSYIYRGFLVISGKPSYIRVGLRVEFQIFLIKPEPGSGFFFKNPYPTLFLIEPGKIRPIRVGPSRVPAGQAKIAIPMPSGLSGSPRSELYPWFSS